MVLVVVSFTEAPAAGPAPWHGSQILVDLLLCGIGVATAVAVWTSRLVLSEGALTATNFFRSRSMPLAEVVNVDWSVIPGRGGKIRRQDCNGIRTFVSTPQQ